VHAERQVCAIFMIFWLCSKDQAMQEFNLFKNEKA